MPSRASAWMTMDASPGASVMRSAPDAIVPSGSRPNASQSVRPSGSTMIRSRSIRSPTRAASASSTSAVATPPSVGSCMAWTGASSHAISTSGSTLSPGALRKFLAFRMVAGGVELVEERRDRGLGGRAGWKQERREEPTRTRAAYGDVIGVDLERVPADLVGGERDRVGGGHEIAVAHVDDRRVLTDLRTDDDAGIPERVLVEDRLQRLGTKLADWQELHAAE